MRNGKSRRIFQNKTLHLKIKKNTYSYKISEKYGNRDHPDVNFITKVLAIQVRKGILYMEGLLTPTTLKLIILGLLSGILSGALGVGSGILLIPALVIILEMTQKVAQGTSLAVMILMALMGTLRYYWNPDIKLQLSVILILSISAVIGSNIGSSIAFMIPGNILRKCFAIFIIIVGIKMLTR